ncbi:MAG TPA: Nif3-like dinuclear metal center hexameric protein, partial [Acidimicrobiia bacterium]
KAPLAEVAASVGQRLQAVVRFAGGGEVRDVAVVPGSGAGFADAASIAGADVLVTGDVTHHQAATASERGLSIIDAGHAITERPGVRSLAASVAAIGVPVLDLTALAADPWQWIP